MPIPEHIREYVVKLLKDIVSIPTVNPPGEHYEECARLLEKELRSLGFETQLIRIPEDYLDRYYPYAPAHHGHPRYIVLARLGSERPILHFNGHYDVVPPGTGWRYDPFKPVEEEGRIYGRGTTDMKGGIAATIAAFRMLIEEGFRPRGTLEAAFVPDEEAGGAGTRYLVEKGYAKPDHVVIGEPTTSSSITIGHKGLVRGVVRVLGKQVHGSVPWMGENAFLKAAAMVVEFMKSYEPLLRSRRTSAPVKYPEGVYPTINLGGLAESTSRKDNIVPGEFVFSFDRRVIPEEDLDAVIEELKRHLDDAAKKVGARYEVKVLSAVPPSLTPMDSEIVMVAKGCVEERLGIEPSIHMTLGRNDAVFYVRMAGSRAINYGPGVEGTAHTPNEYTTVEELVRVVEVYGCVIRRILG